MQHHDTMGEKLRLYDRPVEGYQNKFVITEDAAYFVPCQNNSPAMIEILGEVFGDVCSCLPQTRNKSPERRDNVHPSVHLIMFQM
jgi:hypothetical protein